jgi:protein gp37
MIFVNSMSDLFHDGVPDDFIRRVVRVMELADWHTYQVLTKRSERMSLMLQTSLRHAAELPHIWWGVTAENRRSALARIPHLQAAPAALRFLSLEPLLEKLGDLDLRGIGWVIVGGESGARPRPMCESWVLAIRDQCDQLGIPFFFKQWGGTNKKKAGRLLAGRTHDDLPPHSQAPVANRAQRRSWIDRVMRGAELVPSP